ncbi:hypothetical protein SADUNF_Sadunf04G0112400 [Salix dunnii]|uniref:Uncharacterized protein n=1 Tax=Salix dunnii TaxID=1413687 RepID=A0A835N2W7_9ROSI|nr:hypothetical protein SADUNF_Sadunf04G0112400 [Salix dunnii]
MTDHKHQQLDLWSALQMFLDHIPIIYTLVVELKNENSNMSGAPITNVTNPDMFIERFLDRYVGLMNFSSMECEKAHILTRGADSDENGKSCILACLKIVFKKDKPRYPLLIMQ